MNLARISLSLGIAAVLVGAVLPGAANAQRTVRLRYNSSSNNSAQDNRPFGVDFELTDMGLVENFSYTDGNGVAIIENAAGSLIDTDLSSDDILSYELSLLNVDVNNSTVSNTDISLLFRFDDVSSFFTGLPETPTAQNVLDFLSLSGDSTLNANFVTEDNVMDIDSVMDDDFSRILFSSSDLGDSGVDPFNADIDITILEVENVQVPEPGITLGLFTLGTIGFCSLRKQKQSLV